MSVRTDISTSKPGIRVLSFDGGDFRGLSSLILLRVLMDRITVMENASATLRPSEYFDLIIGTGTGGLSALFLGRMRMTVDEAIEAYLRVGEQGFKRSSLPLLQRLQRKEALLDGDSVTRVIGDIAQKFVGDRDAQLKDPHGVVERGLGLCLTAVLATSSADASAPPFVFRSYRTRIEPASTHSIHQIARATIATAGAFPPISIGFPPIQFVDADVAGYNNPGEVALDEATRVWSDATITCLVSLGTGLQNIVRVGETSEDVMHISRRLVEDCEKVHDRLRQRSLRDGLPYYRFNVATGLDGADIKEWDKETSDFIAGITEGYARKPDVEVSLNLCANILTGNPSANSISREDYEARSLSLLNTIKNDALEREISAWLKAPDSSSSYNDACRKHQEGTCTWFIDGEPFSKWKRDRASFLSLYGKPGSGKTILCSAIITHIARLCDGDKSRAYAYFFFDGRDAQSTHQRHEGFIRSLIQQFVDQCDGIPSMLAELYGKGHQQPSTNALEDILQHILAGFKDAYIIIDSLDECTERLELVTWINKIKSSTRGQLHLLSISRPEKDILDNLAVPHAARIFIERSVEDDIKAFIDRRIQTFDEQSRSKIKDALTQGAQGMFRWVALQLDELHGCSSLYALEKQLRSLPDGLDETYERILLRINKHRRDDAKRFLTWIAFSTTVLTLEQLAEVVLVDFEDPNGPTYDSKRKYRNQGDVLLACSGLITSSDGSLKLAHFSVKEYLLSDRIATRETKYFSINEKLSHWFIAETSIAYLLQLDLPGPLEDNTLATAPLAPYAARNWVFHVRSGGGEGVYHIYKRIVTLLESGNPFENWIRLWDPERSWERTQKTRRATEIGDPLYYASLLGFTGVSRLLIQRGACVDGQKVGEHRALEWGSYIEYGNALQAACAEGHREVAKLLLESGADVNAQGREHYCALHTAAFHGHEATVKLLVEWGADVDGGADGLYGCALQAAADGRHEAIVKLLLERGAYIDGGDGSALQSAAHDGNEVIVRLLLDWGADINVEGGMDGCALQAAACEGHEAIVKLLVEWGADVDGGADGRYGCALQAAAAKGRKEMVEFLLESGADVYAQGGKYGCALQAAAAKGHKEMVEFLLERGADIDTQGGLYGCALQAAAFKGHEEIVVLLLEGGADVDAQGGEYGCALQAAALKGELYIAQSLLDLGAEVSMQGGLYGSPLQAASFGGHLEFAKLLLANHADVDTQGGLCGNALMAASIEGHVDLVELLLENNADVHASAKDCINIVRHTLYKLFKFKDDVFKNSQQRAWNLIDKISKTQAFNIFKEKEAEGDLEREYKHVLQAASHKGHPTIVKTLLDHNADVNAQGGKYGSAIRAALDGGHDEVVKILLEHGATPPPDPQQKNN